MMQCFLLIFLLMSMVVVRASHLPAAWKGSTLGFSGELDTGASKNRQLEVDLDLQQQEKQWQNFLDFSFNIANNGEQLTKKSYQTKGQSRYLLGQKMENYLYGRADLLSDRFSAFDYTLLTALGAGRALYQNKEKGIEWTAQFGLGVRRTKTIQTNVIENNSVLDFDTALNWQVNQVAKLSQTVSVDVGKPATYTEATTALTTQLMQSLSVQFSFQFEHYSSQPPEITNTFLTNTVTKVALVYNI